MTLMKLMALDADDLEILSAHVQDSILKVVDIVALPNERRIVLGLNRFHRNVENPENAGERRRSALHFERVTAIRQRHIRRDAPDAVLSLLAVTFAQAEPPAGTITLVFSGGGEIQLDVECIEARLSDLGAAWATDGQPRHDIDDDVLPSATT